MRRSSTAALVLLATGCASTDPVKAFGQSGAWVCEGRYTVEVVNDSRTLEHCDGTVRVATGGPLSDNFTRAFRDLVALPGHALRAFVGGGL